MGDGDIRLTVWQNLLISGVAAKDAAEVEHRLQAIGLTSQASSIRAGLVACTGNTGCKFAAANTKDTAMAIAGTSRAQVALDTPINVHLTGCPNSCAQHYIGDIGLIACRVPLTPDGDDTVEGFHVHVGGGFGADAGDRARALPRREGGGLPRADRPRCSRPTWSTGAGRLRPSSSSASARSSAALRGMIATEGVPA